LLVAAGIPFVLAEPGPEPESSGTPRQLAANRARYVAAPEEAAKLLAVGMAPRPSDLDPAELAAWTLLANAVLSSDATIVKD
jgi:hypothetical protein